ncbi:MAG: M48 family metalloprotease, partial [Gemmatimonadaceae bacterium]|nr:M48 family metalloprotease [Gemmatimonadaceae bacterium]
MNIRPRITSRIATAIAALLPFLAACSVSEDEEVQMGREYAAEIAQQLPMVTDPAITEYVSRLGRDIASRTSRPDLPWEFHVVNAAEVNAFAVPGGFIYINRGLIDRAERLDELAGVVGHEIGHVVLRHSAEQMEKRGNATGVVTVICVITSLCDGGLANVAINVAGAAWFAKHSRADEAEADSAGIVAVMATGISPRGIPTFFETLLQERQRQPTILDDWFASHPLEEDRVRRTQAIIDAMPAERLDALTADVPSFQALKARLRALPPAPRVAPGTA